MESELGTGLNRQNPRNERVVDLIHMGDTWLPLSCIGGLGQPLPGEINDRVRGLERLIGGNRGKGDPAGNAAGLPIIRFGPTSGDEEQQTRKARDEETQRLVPDRCHKNVSWDLFPAIMVRAGTPHSPDSHLVERTSHDTTVARLPFAEGRGESNRPLVPEPLARNYEGALSHLKRHMSNILPSRPLVGRTYELAVLSKALASAQAGSGTATFLRGDTGTGKSRLASAVVKEAARLRRQLAGRLADPGKRDAALEELRRVHDVFQRIGAKPERKKTRGMFRELDTRPPSTSQGKGAEALSQRELEIARLVAQRKSNKAIAKALGISPRTVSTHLSNAFQKLEIGSRGELADYARDHSLLSGEGKV